MKKVLIIDDEAPARQLIKEYLEAYPDLVCLGEANNGVDAVRMIENFQPDLIFLDVQMPGLTGLQVLEKLNEVPEVIFSTAYDQYAIKAFEINAVDYLLKPFTRERFQKAIEKWLSKPGLQPLAEVIHGQQAHYLTKVLVPTGRKLKALPVDQIFCIKAEGDYASILTEEQAYLSNIGISDLEKKLNPNQFLRIHRSAILNIAQIEEVEKVSHGYVVLLKNKEILKVSRSYLDDFKKIII